MNFEDMKRQLVEEGDFTKKEVEEMTLSQILAAWLELRPFVI